MIANEVKTKNEFAKEIEKEKQRLTSNVFGIMEKLKEEWEIDDQKPQKNFKKLNIKYITTRAMHPRDRLKRKLKKRKDELEFTKQVPMHPRDRLKRIVKKKKR